MIVCLGLIVEIASVLDRDIVSLRWIVLAIALLQDFLGYTHGILYADLSQKRVQMISLNGGRGRPSANMVADDQWDRSRKLCRLFELRSGLQVRYSESRSLQRLELIFQDRSGTSGPEEYRDGGRVAKAGRKASED